MSLEIASVSLLTTAEIFAVEESLVDVMDIPALTLCAKLLAPSEVNLPVFESLTFEPENPSSAIFLPATLSMFLLCLVL